MEKEQMSFNISDRVYVSTESEPQAIARDLDSIEERDDPSFIITACETVNGFRQLLDVYKLGGMLCVYPAENLRLVVEKPAEPQPKKFRVYRDVEALTEGQALSLVWGQSLSQMTVEEVS